MPDKIYGKTFDTMRRRLWHTLEEERPQWILWWPVVLGLGVVAYFTPLNTPPWPWAVGTLCISLLAALLAGAARPRRRIAALTLAIFSLGVLSAHVHTLRVEAPRLAASTPVMPISGTIERLESTGEGGKLWLSDVALEDTPAAATPRMVTVSLKSLPEELRAGQRIRLRAGLFPPSPPAMPGGFDFRRYFYFQGIGGMGFGLLPVEILPASSTTPTTLTERWAHRIAQARFALTTHIRAHMATAEGAVSAAFITGETRAIPDEVNEAMRVAGLYHLLAVSGMNLALVSGILFALVRFVLVAVYPLLPPMIQPWLNPKKIAALLALIGSYAYLVIAGSPVSAERAFLMVAVVLIALVFGREPNPLRTIMFAAVVLLLIEPAGMLGAGFQLSFAATLALIALFQSNRARLHPHSWWQRIVAYVLAASGASLVAGLATAPLLIHHFNQFSSYGLPANIVVEPLVAFVIMPTAVLGVLLMPFGLDASAWWLMEWGVRLMLLAARWFAELPHAMLLLPPLSTAGFAAVVLGGLWLCLWQTRWRWWGVVPCLLGVASMWLYTPPDVLISADGKTIAVRLDDGQYALATGRGESFIAKQWAQRLAIARFATPRTLPENAALRCDREGCNYALPPLSIAIAKRESAAGEECAEADILIAPRLTLACADASLVIDAEWLETHGAAAIWRAPHTTPPYRMERVEDTLGQRPWNQALISGFLAPRGE